MRPLGLEAKTYGLKGEQRNLYVFRRKRCKPVAGRIDIGCRKPEQKRLKPLETTTEVVTTTAQDLQLSCP
jgi:hypothetical protein